MTRIDLNSDLGESFGPWKMGADEGLMTSITSANVACGFHAGDPGVMRETVRLALQHRVAIGAHPGFPDLSGFGRRSMQLSPREIEDLVVYQIGALAGVAAAQGARLSHVKAHGALYNMASREPALAGAIARATAAVDSSLVLVGLSGSALIDAGRQAGLRTASEAFADRGYAGDGSLLPRGSRGALLADPEQVAKRAVDMVRRGVITADDGREIEVRAETICIHGDGPRAAGLARAIRVALEEAGITLSSMAAA